MAEIQETRTFKSAIRHVSTTNQEGIAIFAFHRNLSDGEGSHIKTEEEIRVRVANDKVGIARAKPREQGARPQEQHPPVITEIAQAGKYDEIQQLTMAEAQQQVLEAYVLPLYQ